jgi:hypothetical protein
MATAIFFVCSFAVRQAVLGLAVWVLALSYPCESGKQQIEARRDKIVIRLVEVLKLCI